MKLKILAGFWILHSLLAPGHAQEIWDPAKTWVFMVGVLEWKDNSQTPFPQKDRRDAELAALFQKRGVPQNQILFLKDQEATHNRILKDFSTFAAQANGTLIVYYAGHGTRSDAGTGYFVPYDAGDSLEESYWSIRSIFKTLESKFKGRRVFLLADCCNSGTLATEAAKHTGSFACLSASRFNSLSTGNWTFTESLLAGFGGDPRADANHNRQISLAELASFTELEMAFAEEQLSTFSAINFPADLILSTTPARTDPHYGERVLIGEDPNAFPSYVVESDRDRLKIRYYGYDPTEEWVTTDQARPWKPKFFAVGSEVELLEKKTKSPRVAAILEGKLGVYRIHFHGTAPQSDQWISSDKIKPHR